MIKATSLASGSKGNCLVVQVNGLVILLDCGISYKMLTDRLSHISPIHGCISHVFITHMHGDHYAANTIDRLKNKHHVKVHCMRPGEFSFLPNSSGGWVKAVQADHDEDCVSYIVGDGPADNNKLAYITDTCTIPCDSLAYLLGCSGLVVEANHDISMLMDGKYPDDLKFRVAETHLENSQTADVVWMLDSWLEKGLDFVMASHVSANNNHHDFIKMEIGALFWDRVEIAKQGEVSKSMYLI